MRYPLALVATIVACSIGSLAVATAGERVETKVTMFERNPVFRGKVHSSDAACENGRQITLVRKQRAGGRRLIVAQESADSGGRWAITEPDDFELKPGIYYARAPTTLIDPGTICDFDRSRRVVVD